MINATRFAVPLLLAALFPGLASPLAAVPPSGLPPLESYFTESSRFAERLSPDGKQVAYLGPDERGINQLWRLHVDQPENPVRISPNGGAPVSVFFWLRGNVLLWQTHGPDGRPRLFLTDPQSPSAREILPDEKRDIRLEGLADSSEPCILLSLSAEPTSYPDLFRLKLGPHEIPERICANHHQITTWAWDEGGSPVAGLRWTSDGAKEILTLRGGTGKVIFRADPADDARLLSASADGAHVFIITNRDADLTRVERIHLETGQRTVIASDPLGLVDVEQVIIDSKNERILAAGYSGETLCWQPLAPEFSDLLEQARSVADSRGMSCHGFDADRKHALLRLSSGRDPGAVYLCDMESRKPRLLWREQLPLDPQKICETTAFQYPARDGCAIPAYLTVPRAVKPPWPLVVFPHGGPRMRTHPGFDGRVQFLASRGYAVLQPNFRGSRGYGKAFMNAGDGQWGKGVMQNDVTDGVDFLVKSGQADRKRVAIFGGSYGGYAALAGLAFTPDRYAAGICLFGVSDLIDHTTHFSTESLPFAGDAVRRIGDPLTASGRARLNELSPVNHAKSIEAPLLIYHGAKDTLIPVSHARRMVAALENEGKRVSSLFSQNEAHGFSRPESEMAVYRAIELFLHEHLGGAVGTAPNETVGNELAKLRKAGQADVETEK